MSTRTFMVARLQCIIVSCCVDRNRASGSMRMKTRAYKSVRAQKRLPFAEAIRHLTRLELEGTAIGVNEAQYIGMNWLVPEADMHFMGGATKEHSWSTAKSLSRNRYVKPNPHDRYSVRPQRSPSTIFDRLVYLSASRS